MMFSLLPKEQQDRINKAWDKLIEERKRSLKMENETWQGFKVPQWKEFPHCNNSNIDSGSCPCLYTCSECLFGNSGLTKEKFQAYHDYVEFHDLTKLRVKYDLLPKETQERLKKAWNGRCSEASNIQYLFGDYWTNKSMSGCWICCNVYRLNPDYKDEPTISIGTEIEVKIDGKTYKAKVSEVME